MSPIECCWNYTHSVEPTGVRTRTVQGTRQFSARAPRGMLSAGRVPGNGRAGDRRATGRGGFSCPARKPRGRLPRARSEFRTDSFRFQGLPGGRGTGERARQSGHNHEHILGRAGGDEKWARPGVRYVNRGSTLLTFAQPCGAKSRGCFAAGAGRCLCWCYCWRPHVSSRAR
ncbi:MAG: hypothetical protein PWR07_530 [Bacillota bacterium]|nr:hypothetical protein [Bacillota bacterium]